MFVIRLPNGNLRVPRTATGHDGMLGDVEVEIFHTEVWDAPPDVTATTVRERFAAILGGAP